MEPVRMQRQSQSVCVTPLSSICTSAALLCPQKLLSPVSLVPCSLRGLYNLAELLPLLKTHSLEFTHNCASVTAPFDSVGGAGPLHPPGAGIQDSAASSSVQGSGLVLLWSCTGTAGPGHHEEGGW